MQLIDPVATRRQAIIEDVYMQVARVHHLWRIHSILFGNTQAVTTVRDAAMFTFGTFQELLQNEIILGIQRVLDPQSGKHGGQTASIETALSVLPVAARHNLKTVLKKLRKDCESLKDVRNRELAHRDLKTALLEHPTPLGRHDQNDSNRTKDVERDAEDDLRRVRSGDHE